MADTADLKSAASNGVPVQVRETAPINNTKEILNMQILPGSRVLVFDARKYKNDLDTPLSVTMCPATVHCRYGLLKRRIFQF